MVVLDTDLLSLLERDSGEAATLRRRLRGAEAGAVVTTIINFEEQMRGWLARGTRPHYGAADSGL